MRTLLLIAAVSSTGCYWSSQPQTPHRSVEQKLGSLPDLAAPKPVPLVGSKTVVFGRFDTSAPQPIGGLYDRKEYSVSPLIRTYFFKDGAVEVFEHVSDGLRAAGLLVLKDYAGHAEPTLLDAPLRAKDPVLVTGTVLALQHDQIREKGDGRQEWEAGRLQVAMVVRDVNGVARLSKTYLVEGRIAWDGRTELLKLLGWKLAEQLSADPEFQRAVFAAARGGAS